MNLTIGGIMRIATLFGILLSTTAFAQTVPPPPPATTIQCTAGALYVTLDTANGWMKFQDMNANFLAQGYVEYSQWNNEQHYYLPYSFNEGIDFIITPNTRMICRQVNSCFPCR